MNEAANKNNLLGILVLFVVFTTLGILLSFFYVILQTTSENIWINIFSPFILSGVLAGIAWLCKRFLKITSDVLSLIVVAVGMIIILFVMWNMWFGASLDHAEYLHHFGTLDYPRTFGDIGIIFSNTRETIFNEYSFLDTLREFSQQSTWRINEEFWSGPVLWTVWGTETLILLAFPLLAAYASAGIYILELGVWVKERLMNYGFTAFEAFELDRISMGEIEPILEKPLETKNGPMNAVAVCYYKGEPTDFIAVYKAQWDNEGVLSKSRHIMTVNLGAEKIDALDAGLQAKHYPDVAKKEESQPEEESIAPDTTDVSETKTAINPMAPLDTDAIVPQPKDPLPDMPITSEDMPAPPKDENTSV